MTITKNKVVSFHYTLTDDAGDVLDSSRGHDPLLYLHGAGNIIPGLEEALEGSQVGQSLDVTVPPENAYGMRDDSLIQSITRESFDEPDTLQIGAQFYAEGEGQPHMITVVGLEGDEVIVDANHALAGKTLHFAVEIMDIRDASDEELQHGHAHSGSGHEH